MKTSTTIFFFLLQAFFLSASAINETLVPVDSSSGVKSLVVLLDGNEIFGQLISESKDSIIISTDNGENKTLSSKEISSIVKFDNKFTRNYLYPNHSMFRFFLADKIIKYGTILNYDGSIYQINFDDSVTIDIMKKDIINMYPCFKIRDIKLYNYIYNKKIKIFLKNDDTISGKIMSFYENSENLITDSKYLVIIPRGFDEYRIILTEISDTTAIIAPTKRLILFDGREITGDVLHKNDDSISFKIEPGFAVVLTEFLAHSSRIYDYDYYAKNVFLTECIMENHILNTTFNYERLILPFFGIRIGYNYSFYFDKGFLENNHESKDSNFSRGSSLNFSVVLIPGTFSRLELNLGISYSWIKYNQIKHDANGSFSDKPYYTYEYKPHELINPIIAIGYRLHPKYGGIVCRFGFGYYGIGGGGINMSLGYTY